jgi:FkbM family methyltransferase
MKSLLKSALGKAGLELRRLPHSNQQTSAGRRLAMMRHNRIDTVIDVGANSGQYASDLRQAGFDGSILSFEPLDVPFQQLEAAAARDRSWKAFHFAAGSENARIRINVSGNSVSSSFLQVMERSVHAAPGSAFVGVQEAEIRRLDSVENLLKTDARVLLKMDAQGFEDKVLSGATGLLPQVLLIESELSTVRLYDGQLLLRDMLGMLASYGFEAVNFEPEFIEHATGYCLQVDGMFARI